MKRVFLSLVVFASLLSLASAYDPVTDPLAAGQARNNAFIYNNLYRPRSIVPYGGYGGGYGSNRSAYVNGGYFTPFGYQPYSMTVTPTYGGAIYQGNGGMVGFGTYSPYTYGGFVPSYGYGWGGGY